ncbi:MAG: hypothetical protein ACFFC7_22455 [Candidatus Hermodarchaeota archaeon]
MNALSVSLSTYSYVPLKNYISNAIFILCPTGDTRGNALNPCDVAYSRSPTCVASQLAPRGDVTRKPITNQDDWRVVRDDIPTMRTSFRRNQGYTTTYCRGDCQKAQYSNSIYYL